MSSEEKVIVDESQEQMGPIKKSHGSFKEVVKIQEAKVANDVESIIKTGKRNVSNIEKR
ncbi:MAG: hypothetical protein KAQ64_01795 [Candidatus Pacebacteria bacterium]|nr:hypothetical protein [Candidatus Paceibacterota bacterium]